jgi:hypothetical protein
MGLFQSSFFFSRKKSSVKTKISYIFLQILFSENRLLIFFGTIKRQQKDKKRRKMGVVKSNQKIDENLKKR